MKKQFLILISILLIAAMLQVACSTEKTIAENGDKVKVHYTLYLNGDEEYQSSVGGKPFEFVLGSGQAISGFNDAVIGMKVGESKTVTIPAADAYGEYNDDIVYVIDLDNLADGSSTPQVGQSLDMTIPYEESATGEITISGRVTEVTDTDFTLDANHTLAGEDLTFVIELIDIA